MALPKTWLIYQGSLLSQSGLRMLFLSTILQTASADQSELAKESQMFVLEGLNKLAQP